MGKRLTFSPDDCRGCRICELVCSLRHKGVCGRSGSLVRIVTDDREMVSSALFCHQCRKPPCLELCPAGAIAMNAGTGMVCVDPAKCTGCAACVECPLGGMLMDEEKGLAVNCDLCQGAPACVEFCPTGALRYVSPGEARRNQAKSSL